MAFSRVLQEKTRVNLVQILTVLRDLLWTMGLLRKVSVQVSRGNGEKSVLKYVFFIMWLYGGPREFHYKIFQLLMF